MRNNNLNTNSIKLCNYEDLKFRIEIRLRTLIVEPGEHFKLTYKIHVDLIWSV